MEQAGCLEASACHGGTIAPMMLVAEPETDGEWQDNYQEVESRAGTASSSLFLDKATGAGGHVSSLMGDDPMMERWVEWIEAGAPYEESAGGGPDGGTASTSDAASGGVDAGADGLSWTDDIDPMLERVGCRECHGNSGAYSLESYDAAFGFGTDETPNIVPGDPLSLLAQYCEQGHEDMPATDALVVIEWITDWDAQE